MNTDSPLTHRLPEEFRDKEYRTAFVDANIGSTIAAQIFSTRKDRGWSQAELAQACGMAQARISVMENPDYKSFSIKTLKRLAEAFDVALVVRFVPFSELLDWVGKLSERNLAVPSYEAERAFLERQARSYELPAQLIQQNVSASSPSHAPVGGGHTRSQRPGRQPAKPMEAMEQLRAVD